MGAQFAGKHPGHSREQSAFWITQICGFHLDGHKFANFVLSDFRCFAGIPAVPEASCMNSCRTVAFALIVAAGISCNARGESMPVVHVAVCGLEFDMSFDYRASRPTRVTNSDGMRLCTFNVVAVRPDRFRQPECKTKDEGGQPPYHVCDWVLDRGVSSRPSVQVARARLENRPHLDPFSADEEGRWRLSGSPEGNRPTETLDSSGKSIWHGEISTSTSWRRSQIRNYSIIDAGPGRAPYTLVQLAPDVAVVLNELGWGENQAGEIFRSSLRLGKRKQDLP
ncbi:MAG: hypothetical protein JNN30_06620 [Rhodanobacteraceae bacterium]|nr:hypothetical protein [Rhodanobacteraceae bacterium]